MQSEEYDLWGIGIFNHRKDEVRSAKDAVCTVNEGEPSVFRLSRLCIGEMLSAKCLLLICSTVCMGEMRRMKKRTVTVCIVEIRKGNVKVKCWLRAKIVT